VSVKSKGTVEREFIQLAGLSQVAPDPRRVGVFSQDRSGAGSKAKTFKPGLSALLADDPAGKWFPRFTQVPVAVACIRESEFFHRHQARRIPGVHGFAASRPQESGGHPGGAAGQRIY